MRFAFSASKNAKSLPYTHFLIKAYEESGTRIKMQFDRDVLRMLVTSTFDARSMKYLGMVNLKV